MHRPLFNILRAIKSQEPPCTECKWYDHCASKKAACEMFKNYTETGEFIGDNTPLIKIYKELYKDVRFRIAEVSYG